MVVDGSSSTSTTRRRKFRGQICDNMDRSKNRVPKSQRRKKNQRRERVRRHKVQMREKVAMLRNTVFLLHFCYAVGLRLKPPIVLSGNLFLPGPGSRLHLGLISFLTSFFFQAQIPRGHVYTYVYTAIRDINRLMRPEHP